ncbi:RidA family protein [Flagellimonas sp. CMM7]|uniref:RidA family protein n=1 Tax=Flagellimonas sp. CMM7 TaxID=2654676 RepID=UPI00196A02D3|nr:RidA family protein [Flagellimonas sp. CMM7]UII80348.1 RidA family protein [Flagellimonas sp. CMM7]
MHIIAHKDLLKSNGHYSQCIEHNGLLYLSGQLPIDPKTREIPDTIEAQTDLALNHVETILNAAGSTKNDVLQARIYISNIDLWDKVNQKYSAFFGAHKPYAPLFQPESCILDV